jgi:hypothetical protein
MQFEKAQLLVSGLKSIHVVLITAGTPCFTLDNAGFASFYIFASILSRLYVTVLFYVRLAVHL